MLKDREWKKPTKITQTLVKAGCSYLSKLKQQKITTAKVTTNMVGRTKPHITSVEQNRRVGAEGNRYNPVQSAPHEHFAKCPGHSWWQPDLGHLPETCGRPWGAMATLRHPEEHMDFALLVYWPSGSKIKPILSLTLWQFGQPLHAGQLV